MIYLRQCPRDTGGRGRVGDQRESHHDCQSQPWEKSAAFHQHIKKSNSVKERDSGNDTCAQTTIRAIMCFMYCEWGRDYLEFFRAIHFNGVVVEFSANLQENVKCILLGSLTVSLKAAISSLVMVSALAMTGTKLTF